MSINHILIPELDGDFKSLKVNGIPLLPTDDGRFTPTITVDDGSTISSQVGVYSVIGVNTQAVLDCSIKCELTVATSISAYNFTITLPDAWTCFNSTDIACTGTMFCKGGTADIYLIEASSCVTGQNSVVVKFNQHNITPIPVGVGQNFANFNFKCLVKK